MATQGINHRELVWLTLARLIEFLVVPAAVLTALSYIAGWLYKLNFFATFGIQHELLAFPPEYYLTASWSSFLLGLALLLAGGACSMCAITFQVKWDDGVKWKAWKALVAHFGSRAVQVSISLIPVVLVWFFAWTPSWFPPEGGDLMARFQGSKDLGLGLGLLGVTLVAGILLSSRHLNPKVVQPEDALDTISTVRSLPLWLMFLLLVITYMATFLLMAGWLGQYHARGAILGTKIPLPEVVLYSDVERPLPIKDGTLVELASPSSVVATKLVPAYRYQDLYLVLSHEGMYYVFRRSEVVEDRPLVYVIGKERILYIQLKPGPIFVPIY